MTTTIDLTPAIAVASMQAAYFRKLCRNYGLPSDASWQDVEAAILRRGEHIGFGHAMIVVQDALSGVVKVEKKAYKNGTESATLAD